MPMPPLVNSSSPPGPVLRAEAEPEFDHLHRSPFFSQCGQDEWVLAEVFDCRRRGFPRGGYFVDLACADGVTFSNTLFMERWLGWRGLLIEPNPRFHSEVAATRSSPLCTRCIAAEAGSADFRIDNLMLGGMVGHGFDNDPDIRGEELDDAEVITVETARLADVLEEHGAPREIDYLSLDVEGAEWEVLRGFPFEKYSFKCMTVERPSLELELLLDGAGYLQVRKAQGDTFYIRRDLVCDSAVRIDPRFRITERKDW